MMFHDAQQLVAQFLAPLPLDEFLDRTLNGAFIKIAAQGSPARTELLGPDPEGTLAAAYPLAPKLTFHSANPLGPPPSLEGIADAADFRRRIEEFHARNYSVRFPELRPLSAPLDQLARALEMLLHQPVTTSAFWSRGGMRAPVHHDDHDLIVAQLRGEKRWYISKKPTELSNPWQGIPGAPQELGLYETVDVRPGDLLYLPRGTLHSVDSASPSLHLAVGFTPLTVREALIAALDHLSDLDQTLRLSAGGRLAYQLKAGRYDRLAASVTDAAMRLLSACRTEQFLGEALQRRSARTVGNLAPLPVPAAGPALTLDTVLVHSDRAFCHLTANAEKIDFSYPGGHIYIHRGAQESLLYMVNTPRFAVRDIPGAADDNVRLSLAARLVEIGYLRPQAAPAST
ncbi:MAG TPA: cupin domain-containing protein [Steroidobacteraceae bacterium]|jgi:hypothetical protein|nr:cupin domain-containing protein [Steroidobacteraceae bacterium]